MREWSSEGPVPGRGAGRLLVEVERGLVEVDAFLAELEVHARAPDAASGRLAWRSTAAEHYERRLAELRDRLAAATRVVAEGRDALERRARVLRVLADAEAGTLWPTS